MEMFTVYGVPTETPDGAGHLALHVELNPDLFAGLNDDQTRNLLKTAGEAILTMVDGIEIDRSEVE